MHMLLYCLLGFISTFQSWLPAASQPTDATSDPVAFMAMLSQLPPEQQDAILKLAGEELMKRQPSLDCNIFGGKESCKTIPEDTKFAQTCKKYRPDLKVDCAYYSSSEDSLQNHPGDALQHYLQDSFNTVSEQCPECPENLQALWCAQALPECGSFQEHVHKAIFPAFAVAKAAEDQGQPQSIAIAEAVPGLIKAISKTMSCREMCEAAVTTCSCGTAGSGLTFGNAITSAEKNEEGFAALGLPTLGEDFRSTLFKDIWDKPVCDIFWPKNDTEFAGYCDEDVVGSTCTKSDFCEGIDDGQKAGTEAIIASQLARAVFGFVEGPAGVIAQHKGVEKSVATMDPAALIPQKKPGTGVSSSTPDPVSSTETPEPADTTTTPEVEEETPDKKKKGSTIGTAFGTILLVAVVSCGAYFGWKKYQEYQRNRGDYTAMGMDMYGDDGIPLQ